MSKQEISQAIRQAQPTIRASRVDQISQSLVDSCQSVAKDNDIKESELIAEVINRIKGGQTIGLSGLIQSSVYWLQSNAEPKEKIEA